MDIKIKKMNKDDLEKIKDSLANEFDDFWNYNTILEELNCKDSYYIVAILKDEIVGFAGIKIIIDTADIMNIVTKKSYRKKGVGSLLLENLLSISKNNNLVSISLEVNELNTPAISLYKKFDFEELGIRKNYYKNNNAIIMTKKLN